MRRYSMPLVTLLVLLTCALPLASCTGYGKPNQPATELAFGVDMARRGLWNEALFRFHEAERGDPQNPRVHNNLGVAYEAQGDFETALAHYKRALQLAPENKEVRANYARFVEFYQAYKSPEKKGKGGGLIIPKPAPGPGGHAGNSGEHPPGSAKPSEPGEPSNVPPPGPAGAPGGTGTPGTRVPPVQPPTANAPSSPPPQSPPPSDQPAPPPLRPLKSSVLQPTLSPDPVRPTVPEVQS